MSETVLKCSCQRMHVFCWKKTWMGLVSEVVPQAVGMLFVGPKPLPLAESAACLKVLRSEWQYKAGGHKSECSGRDVHQGSQLHKAVCKSSIFIFSNFASLYSLWRVHRKSIQHHLVRCSPSPETPWSFQCLERRGSGSMPQIMCWDAFSPYHGRLDQCVPPCSTCVRCAAVCAFSSPWCKSRDGLMPVVERKSQIPTHRQTKPTQGLHNPCLWIG